jgi:transmembrane sensor
MDHESQDTQITNAIDTEAARWFARLSSENCSDTEEQAFFDWLHASPRHEAAYRSLQKLWGQLGEYAEVAGVMSLRKSALSALPEATDPILKPPVPRRSAFLVVSAALAATVFGISILAWREPAQKYSTQTGQRLRVNLADSSAIDIGPDSSLEVSYSTSMRHVSVIQGRAFFDVTPDPARPFVVETPGGVVSVMGTAFDVNTHSNTMEVILVDGLLKVEPIGRPDSSHVLTPGQRFSGANGGVIENIDALAATSWRTGRLTFLDEPLNDALLEFNRYSEVQIFGNQSQLRDLRISGVFRLGHPETFVEALEAAFPLRAVWLQNKGVKLEIVANP